MRSTSLVLAYALLALVACVQGPQKPLTAEDRCVLLCEGNDGDHPCSAEEPAADCVSTCTAHIEPLADECLTCVLTQSGWIGSACVCEEVDAFGNLDVTCDLCTYTTHETKCARNDTCERDLSTCDGFVMVDTTDSTCSQACGT